ncbi:hypothetical protein LUZ60_007247 [Juncus effusus]|nr:hypothetical protein LUZ60_007247 [Juncus effusus]
MPLFTALNYSNLLSHFRHLSASASGLASAGELSSRLASRAVLRFSGPDAANFLQNLLTNDINPLAQPPSQNPNQSSNIPTPNVALYRPEPVYAALLTPQGRFLYDLVLYGKPPVEEKLDKTGSRPGKESGKELGLLADVDSSFVDEIITTFKRYRLRSKVEIENLSGEFSCWQRYGSAMSDATSAGWGKAVDHIAESAEQGNEQGWQWFRDPRLGSLGYRGIFPSDSIPPLVEADTETDEKNYTLWRILRGVPEGSTEIPKGEAIPLEYNFAALNAISFDKGCYIGQELIARTHHRGVIRKRLTPFQFLDPNGSEIEQGVSPNSDIINEESGKKVGNVNTVLGCYGMGLLKIEEAFKSSSNLIIKDQNDVRIRVFRPDWWPEEWTSV